MIILDGILIIIINETIVFRIGVTPDVTHAENLITTHEIAGKQSVVRTHSKISTIIIEITARVVTETIIIKRIIMVLKKYIAVIVIK